MPDNQSAMHDVRFDRAGSGWPRLTCWDCPPRADVTCLRKAYMTNAEWQTAVKKFREKHPFTGIVPVR